MTAMHKRPSSLDSGTTAALPLGPDWIGFSGTFDDERHQPVTCIQRSLKDYLIHAKVCHYHGD
jgi:hypothetical protein